MKTKEELDALKNEVKDLNAKLAELNEDELKEVTGGVSEEELNGKITIKPISEVNTPSIGIGYDINYEKGTEGEPNKPTNAGEYCVPITPKGEYDH